MAVVAQLQEEGAQKGPVFADKGLVAVHVVELDPGSNGVALGSVEDVAGDLGIAAGGEAGQAEGNCDNSYGIGSVIDAEGESHINI